ncbi:hypothetical protein NA56DRAFT_441685 [Hyaloscypha hepaticicola]|uniref:RING-type domain-containing protein n=1 Tax=Hyaloscypha hepaticicola TaxID=2082293 RepID=A0A2J6PH11_9HELO|nr:hypothetical protein NA56DRAFT_441685 [Hyaloscypha hepaticicola]
MQLQTWESELGILAQERRQANSSGGTDYSEYISSQNPNPQLVVLIPLISVFCGTTLLVSVILVWLKYRRGRHRTTPTGPTPIEQLRHRGKKKPEILNMAFLSIPIIKFNNGDQKNGWKESGPELPFARKEATMEAIGMGTAVMQMDGNFLRAAEDLHILHPNVDAHQDSSASQQLPTRENCDSSARASNNHFSSWKGIGTRCTICDEDFQNGQDVRLLPCNHGYHPYVSILGSLTCLQHVHYGNQTQ